MCVAQKPITNQRLHRYAAWHNEHRPWQTVVFSPLQVRVHERCTDWIAPARRERSGLNGHEHPEHCRDSICASRRSPSQINGYTGTPRGITSTAPGKQWFLVHCGFGCTSGVQIGSRQRAGSGVASMAMSIPSTAAIQYACRAEAHHKSTATQVRRVA